MDKTIWDREIKEFPRAKGTLNTSILVIGGGISGILTAFFLHKAGYKVIVVEGDRLGSERTRRTTAVITALQDVMYFDIAKTHGIDSAKLFYESNLFALNEYEKLSEKYEFAFENTSSYKYFKKDDGLIEKEQETLSRIGAKYEVLDEIDLPIKFYKALKFPHQGQMNPMKLIEELSKDLEIYEHSKIDKIGKNIAKGVDFSVIFEHVVICTGYPFFKIRGLFPLKMYQNKSHIIIKKNSEGFVGNGIGSNTQDIYFRNYLDYLILGAMDSKTGDIVNGFDPINQFILSNYNVKDVKMRWINQDSITFDSIPYIGRYSFLSKNRYVMTGYNLWGMTAAMTGAHLIKDLIMGKENKYKKLFSPTRKVDIIFTLNQVKTAVVELLKFKRYRCTHLGCSLHYNSLDCSYECKCHGSKYDKDGKIIFTPTKKNIKK